MWAGLLRVRSSGAELAVEDGSRHNLRKKIDEFWGHEVILVRDIEHTYVFELHGASVFGSQPIPVLSLHDNHDIGPSNVGFRNGAPCVFGCTSRPHC